MKYFGKIEDSKDIATKEYVDNKIPGGTTELKAISQIYGVNSGATLIGSTTPTLLPFTSIYNTNPDKICAALVLVGTQTSYQKAIHIVEDIDWVRLDAQMSLGSGATSGSSIYLYVNKNGVQVATLGWEKIMGNSGYVNAAGVLMPVAKGDVLQLYGRVTTGSPTLGGGYLTRFTVSEV